MGPPGLRARATALGVVLCAVVLVLGAVLLVTTLERQLTSSSDQLSRSRARDLLAQAAAGDLPPVLTNVTDDSVAQVVAADGTVLAASPNIAGAGPIVPPDSSAGMEQHTIQAPDDSETETYRVWVASGPGDEGPVTVVSGASLESVREASTAVRRALVVGVPLAVLVLGLLMWLVLGRALGRLDRIRAEVDAIGPDQLERRVADDGRRDEVGRLAATMNAMLARVEGAVQRQRQLVADVSHDLQSPLAAQRLALELALAGPRPIDPDVLRSDVLGATTELERLVADLLVLAAADEGAPVSTTAVDLDGIVLEEAVRARQSGVSVDTTDVSAGPVRANPDQLRRVVRNLVENAVQHAATRISLAVGTDHATVWLEVSDDGPGVPEAEQELVFERFHRADRARSRGNPGTGLGLAIARTLAERAGGSVAVVNGPPGATFRLELPRLP